MSKVEETTKTEVAKTEQEPTIVNEENQIDPTREPEITAADLQLMVKIIDLASRRGAFMSNELSAVGGLNDRITGYLNFIQQPQKPAPKKA